MRSRSNWKQPTKGLEAIIARENVFYDNYFDWSVKLDAPLYNIKSIHADETTSFTHHTFKAAFKGMGAISKSYFVVEFNFSSAGEQLTEQHWDLKSGKITKEVFWHVKKN